MGVTLGEIRGHFWVLPLGGRWGPRRLLNTPQCSGGPGPETELKNLDLGVPFRRFSQVRGACRKGTLAVTTSIVVAQRPWG